VSARIRSVSGERVKDGDNQVDNDGQIEEDLTPDGQVRAVPEGERLSAQFLVPFHLSNISPTPLKIAATSITIDYWSSR
jgi:hypothetical protein